MSLVSFPKKATLAPSWMSEYFACYFSHLRFLSPLPFLKRKRFYPCMFTAGNKPQLMHAHALKKSRPTRKGNLAHTLRRWARPILPPLHLPRLSFSTFPALATSPPPSMHRFCRQPLSSPPSSMAPSPPPQRDALPSSPCPHQLRPLIK